MAQSELVDNLITRLSAKYDHKLDSISLVDDLPSTVRKLVSSLYSNDTAHLKILGTLINAAYTCQMTEFLMSKALMSNLLELDHEINGTRKSINGKEFATLKSMLFARSFMEPISEYEVVSEKHPDGKAGKWAIIDNELLSLLRKEVPLSQEEIADMIAHEEWDDYEGNSNIPITDEILVLADQIRSKLNDEVRVLEQKMQEHLQKRSVKPQIIKQREKSKDEAIDEMLAMLEIKEPQKVSINKTPNNKFVF